MNVCILLLEDFPGSDNRVQRQCRTLLNAGHSVTVYCATGPSKETLWEDVQIFRSKVRRVKGGSLVQRLFDYTVFPAAAWFWLLRHGKGFDVVQVANPPDWLVMSALGWRRGDARRRLVLDVHDPMPELMAAKTAEGLLSRTLVHLERASCRAADLVTSPTRPLQSRLKQSNGIEPVFVPNAVDTALFALRSPDAAPYAREPLRVVFHGTIAHRFGVDVAVEAMRILGARGVPAHLDVYGDGNAMLELRSLAEEVGPALVTVHGQVASASLPRLYEGAAIGLAPYRDSSFMRLAASSKALEYAALGVPVVGSDLPALRSQLGDAGAVYVKAGDPEALADGIQRLAADPAAAVRMAEAAQVAARGAEWTCWEQTYLDAVTGGSSVA